MSDTGIGLMPLKYGQLRMDGKKLVYEPDCGVDISQACKESVHIAVTKHMNVDFKFNGTDLHVTPKSDPQLVLATWNGLREKAAEAYRESPEGKAAEAQSKQEIIDTQNKIDALMVSLPQIVNDEEMLLVWMTTLSNYDREGTTFDNKKVVELAGKAGHYGRPIHRFAEGQL